MAASIDPALHERVQEIVASVLRRRADGEALSDEEVLAEHSDLADLLRPALAAAEADRISDPGMTTPGFAGSDPAMTTPGLSGRGGVPDTIDHVATPTRGSQVGGKQLRPSDLAALSEVQRFQKIRNHAAGGMGQVFVAKDLQFDREVAFKELKTNRRNDESARHRFIFEGRVTGVLDHPGVVPVYALGLDAMQQPYYAMRFIRGESLRRTIKTFHETGSPKGKFSRHNHAFRELLGRFASVCVTVSYAHSKGVLHRDLKPDNVMVGKYGETYVVDWGMARVVGAQAEDPSTPTEEIIKPVRAGADSATRYGSTMGTPGFMSPEQAAGLHDQLTGAADVYSLGAILYFILANKPSIAVESITAFLRKVKEGDIPHPAKINSEAPKALSAVCMKAMSTTPDQRYTTARELANEIDRWLADEPVLALPETSMEKLSRYARRHYRWLVPLLAASLLVALTAIIAAGSINRSRRQAEDAADAAKKSAAAESKAKTQAVAHFHDARDTVDLWLTGFTDALTYYPGVSRFRQRMLEQAAARYEQFLKDVKTADADGGDLPLALEAARTRLRLGNIHKELLVTDKAIEAYNGALQLFQILAKKSDVRFDALEGMAQAYDRLALVHAAAGDLGQAEQSHQRAIDAARSNVDESTKADHGRRPDYEATLGNLEVNYAMFIASQGDLKRADVMFAEAVKRFDKLAKEAGQSRESSLQLEARTSMATAMLGWGQVTLKLGDSAKARDMFRQAADDLDALSRLSDETPRYMKLTADARSFLAIAEGQLGDYAAESDAHRQTIDAYATLNEALPDNLSFTWERARAQIDLGQVLLKMGDVEAALPELEAAEQSLAELKAAHPAAAPFQEAHGLALDHIAAARAIQGQHAEALSIARTAVDEFQSLAEALPEIPEYSVRAATSESHLAQTLALMGDFEESLKTFERAAKRLEPILSPETTTSSSEYAAATIASRLSETLWMSGDKEGAAGRADAADAYWKKLLELSADGEYLAAAAWHYATFPVADKRDASRAREYARSALRQSPKNRYYQVLVTFAELQPENAKQSIEALAEMNFGVQDTFANILAKFAVALAHAETGQANEAQTHFDAAVSEMDARLPGSWELGAIRREVEQRLSSTAAPADAD